MSNPPANIVQVNGITQVSDANLNTYVQWCPNVVTLRTFTGIGQMNVYLGGFTTVNDGGEGTFYWNASGTAADDAGITTVVPSGSASGCWTRFGSGNTSTVVNQVTNSDGSLTISPTAGNVVASLGSYAANTVLANATASSAQPTGVALTASTLLGRGPSGNIAAIPYSTFSISPQVTVLTSGTGTYTVPANTAWLTVEMAAGGAGGGGSISASGGSSGNNSTFGSSFLTCNGGSLGSGATGGAGGAISTGGDINFAGQNGQTGSTAISGNGGSTFFGGGGASYTENSNGAQGVANTGGGGGGGNDTSGFSGGGGGAGSYLRKTITSPSTTYTYAVGAGGTGQTGTTNGGAGAAGIIIVTAYIT